MSAPQGVDVLAVMDAHVSHERNIYLDQLSKYGHIAGLAGDLAKIEAKFRGAEEAREAVSELIQKASAVTATGDDRTLRIAINDLRAALSRIGSAK